MAYFIITISLLLICFYLYKLKKTDDLLLLLPIFYNFVVLYSLVGVFIFRYSIEVPFDFYNKISDGDIYKSAGVYVLASYLFFLGSSFVKKSRNNVPFKRKNMEIKRQGVLIFSILCVYSLYIAGYSLEALLYRRGYIDSSFERNKSILIIFFVCSPFVTTLIPFIRKKVVKYFIYLLCFLIIFSASSRFIIMLPFLYIVGTFLRFNIIKIRVVLFNSMLICISLIFVLQIRYYDYHGLIPNLISLFSKGVDTEYLWVGLNYALSFSLFGTSYVLKSFSHDPVAFYISLNPLPSRFLNLDLLSSQRMLGTSPMSAVSILSLSGYATLSTFYFITGAVFSYILNKMKGVTFLYYAVVGLFIMFTLFSIQYNLRGLSRFFYYSIIVFVIYNVTKKIKLKR